MEANKFVRLKPKSSQPLELEVQPEPDPEVEIRRSSQAKRVIQLSLPLESKQLPTIEPELELEPELDSELERVQDTEPLALTYKAEALFGSGWGYSHLLKEFRE